jgi:hypothetical protein
MMDAKTANPIKTTMPTPQATNKGNEKSIGKPPQIGAGFTGKLHRFFTGE